MPSEGQFDSRRDAVGCAYPTEVTYILYTSYYRLLKETPKLRYNFRYKCKMLLLGLLKQKDSCQVCKKMGRKSVI